jgi:ribose/xylose/arabinose/galactoside ABC-type transport system permease subunit
MHVHDNPYESPLHSSATIVTKTSGLPAMIIALAKLSFWLGLALTIYGSPITFYPGAECSWFATAALLLAPGFLVPSRSYRIVACIACALCLLYAYSGYHRGIKYGQWR